jgi:hypothetical protein
LGAASHCQDIELAVFSNNLVPVIKILLVITAVLIFKQGISTVKSDQHCIRLITFFKYNFIRVIGMGMH